MVFVRAILAEGAPSLRSLQGWAAMLPIQRLSVLYKTPCEGVRGSRLLQSAQRTGHLLRLERQRDQQPGPPAVISRPLACHRL
jgi:hypothetical protein